MLIELWKVTRAVNVALDRRGCFPRVHFSDKAGYGCAAGRLGRAILGLGLCLGCLRRVIYHAASDAAPWSS